MPTFSRQTLRALLTTDYLRDGITGNLTATGGLNAFIDGNLADLSLSGQALYARSWIKHNGMELRVASFNAGSGAFVTQQLLGTLVVSGGNYEVHFQMPPADKDRALNDAIKRVRVRREVGLPSVDGLHVYTLDGAASPHLILDVLDAYWFATPSGSLGKGKQSFTDTGVVMTATGRELWVEPALGASMQVVLDAVLTLTLGAADTATVNMPVDDRWLLNMAAAKAMDFLIRKAPGQNRGQLVQDRADFAAQVTRLAPRNQPQVDRTLEGLLDDPWDGED